MFAHYANLTLFPLRLPFFRMDSNLKHFRASSTDGVLPMKFPFYVVCPVRYVSFSKRRLSAITTVTEFRRIYGKFPTDAVNVISEYFSWIISAGMKMVRTAAEHV